ncbi:unnamed protein product [marine sediment metagenome]|uniref:Uncharacterized protein n=1 Tax=marine sediment metagenome TaxID=412755 RepID=X1EH00_9ZZZZ
MLSMHLFFHDTLLCSFIEECDEWESFRAGAFTSATPYTEGVDGAQWFKVSLGGGMNSFH